MLYVFLVLLGLNILTFGYYSFLHQPSAINTTEQANLTNPVNYTNATSELPPLIGTKK